jgi:hypothetical protein
MIRVDHRSFNQITMIARGTRPDGTAVKIRMTYAFGPGLTAWNETDGCWLCAGEWEWVNW